MQNKLNYISINDFIRLSFENTNISDPNMSKTTSLKKHQIHQSLFNVAYR